MWADDNNEASALAADAASSDDGGKRYGYMSWVNRSRPAESNIRSNIPSSVPSQRPHHNDVIGEQDLIDELRAFVRNCAEIPAAIAHAAANEERLWLSTIGGNIGALPRRYQASIKAQL